MECFNLAVRCMEMKKSWKPTAIKTATRIVQKMPQNCFQTILSGLTTIVPAKHSRHKVYCVDIFRFKACASSSCSNAEDTISVSATEIPSDVAACLHRETAFATSTAICLA